MRRRKARRLTLVEWLIIFALLGIITSLSHPKAPSSHARTGASAPSPRVSTEGRHNAIETPDARRQRSREAVPMGSQMLRVLVRLIVVAGLLVFLPLYLQWRRRQSPRRPPQHQHPPDVPE